MRRACSSAAPSRPSTGSRRVLANPGTGALARIAIVTGSVLTRDVSVLPCQRRGLGAEEIRHAQAPHQQNGAENATLLPPPSGSDNTLLQTKRRAEGLQAARQRNVFHQSDFGKPARGRVNISPDEHRL